jgi:hypothetical protein
MMEGRFIGSEPQRGDVVVFKFPRTIPPISSSG